MFSNEQMSYIRSLGLNLDFNHLTANDYADIEARVADKLEVSGFDKNYNLTNDGKMCEAIIDVLCQDNNI